MSLSPDFTPVTHGPRAAPLALVWAVPTLLTVETAIWQLWPSPNGPVSAMIGFGCAFLLAFVIASAGRSFVLEVTSDLTHVARFWISVAHVVIFALPLTLLAAAGHHRPQWPLGGIALALALSAQIVRASTCHALFAVLLFLWWGLLALRPQVPPALPQAAIGLLLFATGATHVHFRHAHFQRTAASFTQPLLGALGAMAIALPLGWALWWLIPDSLFIRPAPPVIPDVESQPVVFTEELRVDLTRLLVELAIVTGLGMGAIIVLGRWLKRLRQRSKPLPPEPLDMSPEGDMWDLPPERPHRRTHGHSPRERVIAAYHGAAERMTARGWDFPDAMTAREFLGEASERQFPAREALGALTGLFEAAKYGRPEPSGVEVEEASRCSTQVGAALTQR